MNEEQPAKTAAAAPVANKRASPFVTDGYRLALDHLNRAFTERLPLAILTGEDHAGLSYIISSFLEGIGDDVTAAHITEPCTDATAGIRKIVQALGFDSNDMGLADLKDVFEMFLSLQKMHDLRTVICIDEAQDDGPWVLGEVNRLVELEKEGEFGLVVILSGGSDLNDLVSSSPLSTLPANVGPRIALAPFTLAETMAYVKWRVEPGGRAYSGPVFETDAITLVHNLAKGVPDTISNLCNDCLELAQRQSTTAVTARIVNNAAEHLGLTNALQSRDGHAASGGAGSPGRARGRLIIRMKGQTIQEQSLSHGELIIGRDSLSEIQLEDMAVSRRHAKLIVSSNGVALTDLGSRNGTLVNRRKIKQYTLKDRDTITIGQCTIEYVAGGNGPAR